MKISCIVPVYNEAKRISNVINILINCDLIDDIIVVNDASTDNTQEVINRFSKIIVFNHQENKGKTQAVLTGLEKAKNDIIMLIDADLIGMSSTALEDLINPVIKNEVDVTISLRKNALFIYKLLGIDFVSGERVFHKDLLIKNYAQLHKLPGFGLEVYLNEQIIKNKLKIKIVNWGTVISPRKSSKIGFFLGSLGDIKMIFQIFKTVSIFKCLKQIYIMRKLSKSTL